MSFAINTDFKTREDMVSTMSKVLIKDIIIPAGTVFKQAPNKIKLCNQTIECIIGLTNNTYGTLLYSTVDDKEKLKEWFIDLKE